MENHAYSSVIGTTDAPYMTSLAKKCASSTNWNDAGSQYKSLPNYIAMTSGGVQGITTDGKPADFPPVTADNIFRQVHALGKTTRTYSEDMTSNCAQVNQSGNNYAVRHNPEAFYVGGTDSTACQTDNISMGTYTTGNLANDLKNDTMATFSFLVPNICNDTHNCLTPVGDSYLKNLLPVILNSKAYTSGTTAVVVLYDENTPIPNIIIAPSVRSGAVSGTAISHYSLLRTTEEMLGITNHLGAAANAPSMRSMFNW